MEFKEVTPQKEKLFGQEKILGLDMSKRSRRWLVKGVLIGAAISSALTLVAFGSAIPLSLFALTVTNAAISGGFYGFVLSKILQPDIQKGQVLNPANI